MKVKPWETSSSFLPPPVKYFEVLLNYKLVTESETLGDILFISSSTSGEVLLNHSEKILRPPIKTNWMKTLWAFSAIDKLQYKSSGLPNYRGCIPSVRHILLYKSWKEIFAPKEFHISKLLYIKITAIPLQQSSVNFLENVNVGDLRFKFKNFLLITKRYLIDGHQKKSIFLVQAICVVGPRPRKYL